MKTVRIPTIRLFNHCNPFKTHQITPFRTISSTTNLQQNDIESSLLLEKNLVHRNNFTHSDVTNFRCTIFNSQGELINVSKDIKRSELVSKYGLFPRDLRKVEKIGINHDITPSISVRKDSILANLLNINALIKYNTVVIFDDLTSSKFTHSQSKFINDLESKLKSSTNVNDIGDLPYEIRALECVLISAITNLTSEMKVHTTVTQGILNELEQDITREKLRYLLIQNKKISTFAQRATLVRDVIDELLENDDDLAGLYLTEKIKGTPRSVDDHAEVEMLLESYYKHCDEIVQTINNSISNVRTTEEIINIILDSNRNQLMLLGLRFSIGLLSMGAGLFIAAAYGMNLENFIEEQDYGLSLVVVVSSLSIFVLFCYSLKHLNKLQKITMMGDQHRKALKDQR